jgi:hypothetical protein
VRLAAWRAGYRVRIGRLWLHNPFCWGSTTLIDSASQVAAEKASTAKTGCTLGALDFPSLLRLYLHALLLAVHASVFRSIAWLILRSRIT